MDITKENKEYSPAKRSSRMGDAYLIVCAAICVGNWVAYTLTKAHSTAEFVTGLLALVATNIVAAYGGFRFHKAMVGPGTE